jgi:DNA-directed RNA polymerase III subunit RPC2
MIKTYPNRTYDRLVYPKTDTLEAKYEILEPDGLAGVGETIKSGHVYINKQTPIETSARVGMDVDPTAVSYKNTPMVFKYPGEATVDDVLLSTNEEDQTIIKVRMLQNRRPELGDKFSSRHGQKGVCGIIVNQEDMPFTDLGICPDIIMNPHGFPSRMTVGKMIELLAGKAGVLKGEFQYGTVSHSMSLTLVFWWQ